MASRSVLLRLRFAAAPANATVVADAAPALVPMALGAYPRTLEFARYLTVHGYTFRVTSDARMQLARYLRESGLEPYALLKAPDGRRVPADVHLIEADPCELELGPPFDRFARVFAAGRSPELSAGVVERFRSVVAGVHEASRREMPWRETRDPYCIMVSEFMLQQTQVSRVEPKYREFLRRFPDVEALAAASLHDVLQFWQGLGYNRRAKNLREAAAAIVRDHGSVVPEELPILQRLPGVGPYTAAAIAAFAFEKPVVVLETNIRRLMLHYFFRRMDDVDDRHIVPLLDRLRPPHQVREWYYALMDYGAAIGRLLPNANRRSRHYTRQSAFSGSVREVRGKIVRVLSGGGSVTFEQLERLIGPTDARFLPALAGLERDGIVVVESGRVRLS